MKIMSFCLSFFILKQNQIENQIEMAEFKLNVATWNLLSAPYGFLWGNHCALNEPGKQFINNLQQQMDKLKAEGKAREAGALGANTVKDLLKSGDWTKYSSSPQRETRMREILKKLSAQATPFVLGVQEAAPSALKLLSSDVTHLGTNALFDLSLGESDKVLEPILTRGNAILHSKGPVAVGQFSVNYTRATDEKTQTRYATCQVFDISPSAANFDAQNGSGNEARVCVCSVHITGYDSRGYQKSVVPDNESPEQKKIREAGLNKFKASYEEGQNELAFYAQEIEPEARKRGADLVVMVGDFNQCGNTQDNVGKVPMKARETILLERGWLEAQNVGEPTTYDPRNPKHVSRRLDRIFLKSLTSRYALKHFNTYVPSVGERLDELSDHALVMSEISLVLNSKH